MIDTREPQLYKVYVDGSQIGNDIQVPYIKRLSLQNQTEGDHTVSVNGSQVGDNIIIPYVKKITLNESNPVSSASLSGSVFTNWHPVLPENILDLSSPDSTIRNGHGGYTSSTQFGSATSASKAFDNILTTGWQSKQNQTNNTTVDGTIVTGDWLQIDIGQEVILEKFIIVPKEASENVEIKSAKIASSGDGITWTEIYSFTRTYLPYQYSEEEHIISPTQARYFRMIVTEMFGTIMGDPGPGRVKEWRLYGIVTSLIPPPLTDIETLPPNETEEEILTLMKTELEKSDKISSGVVANNELTITGNAVADDFTITSTLALNPIEILPPNETEEEILTLMKTELVKSDKIISGNHVAQVTPTAYDLSTETSVLQNHISTHEFRDKITTSNDDYARDHQSWRAFNGVKDAYVWYSVYNVRNYDTTKSDGTVYTGNWVQIDIGVELSLIHI